MDASVAGCEVADMEVDGLPGIAVAGELDAATCGKLAAALARASKLGDPVVLDLGACTFIDSAALGVIIRAVRRKRKSCGLVICNAHGFVGVVLDASGLLTTDGVYQGVRDWTPVAREGARR